MYRSEQIEKDVNAVRTVCDDFESNNECVSERSSETDRKKKRMSSEEAVRYEQMLINEKIKI